MKKFFTWLGTVLSSSNEASSKRFNGTVGFMVVQLCIIAAVVLELTLTKELSELLVGVLKFDIVVSSALLGLGSITDKIKKV